MRLRFFLFALLAMSLFSSNVLAAVDDAYAGYEFDDVHLSGAIPLDVSGNNRDGTFSSADTGAVGIIGQAFDFEASNNDNVSLTDQDGLSTGFAISLWINPESDTEGIVVSKRDGNNNDFFLNYRIKLNVGGTFSFFAANTAAGEHCSNNNIGNVGVGVWSHIIFDYDGSNCRVYVNNTLVHTDSTLTGTIYTHDGPAILGSNGNGSFAGTYYDGLLDEYYFYQHNLSAGDRAALWNSGSGFQPYGFGNATVSARDAYTNNFLTNFSVLFNGSTYTTTNGTVVLPILTNSTSLWNLTYNSTETGGYFNRTYTDVNFSVSNTGNLHQAEITFNASNRVSGAAVTTFTANTSYNGGSASNTATSPQLNLSAGDGFIAEFNKNGYYAAYTDAFNTSAFEQSTKEFSVYDHVLNVTLTVTAGSASDQNFSIDVYSQNWSFHERLSTTNGEILFNLTDGDYTLWLNDSEHALTELNVTLNSSVNFTSVSFEAATTNSVSINFYDEDTNNLIDYQTVTVFITGTFESVNGTTSNGTFYVDLLTPDTYTITYVGDGYGQREYTFSLDNRSVNQLDLYLLNTSATNYDVVTITVQDNYLSPVAGAIVTALKKNLSGTNYYGVQTCTANTNGQCLMDLELIDTTYRFTVSVDGSLASFTSTGTPTSGDTKLSTTTVTLSVLLVTDTNEALIQASQVSTVMSWTNATSTFQYEWQDNNGLSVIACLGIDRRRGGTTTQISYECTPAPTATGTLSYVINRSTGDEFTAKGYYIIDGTRRLGVSRSVVFSVFADGLGLQGLFIFGFIILMTAGFAGLWHPVAGPAMIAITLIALQLLGLVSIGITAIGGLVVAIVISIYLMKT